MASEVFRRHDQARHKAGQTVKQRVTEGVWVHVDTLP